MSASCASSLVLPSLNPKILSLSKKPILLSYVSPVSSCLKLQCRPISVPTSVFQSLGALKEQSFSSRFVRKVAVYDQEEEVLSDGDEPSLSPDLKLFVGNLPFSVDSSQLADLFSNAGTVEMVEVIYDKITGRSRGFGFVTMSTPEEVEAAAQQFNGYELEGRALRVNSGPPPQRESSFSRGPRTGGSFDAGNRESSFSRGPRTGGSFDAGNRVYVGNLSWGVDNLALENLFSEQGKVVEAKVVYDRDSGRSRGFGFVTYSSAEEVNSAIETLNGVELDGREIRVSVAEARPRRQF